MRLWSRQTKKWLPYSIYVLVGGFLIGTLFFVWANILVTTTMEKYIFMTDNEDLPEVDAVVILWAMVYSDGRLSRAVQERVDEAITLRKAGKARKILISWDNRTRYYDEVTTIKNYLFAKDIPAEAIFLDFAWLDTYDSMYRAQYIFQVQSLLIPTQAFHVDRAVFLARRLGIDAYGTITDTYTLPQLGRLHLREFFARGKAWRDILMWSSPRHLGEQIPITGKSNSS